MKIHKEALRLSGCLIIASTTTAFDGQDQTFEAFERALTAQDDCPTGNVRQTNFVNIEYSIVVGNREDVKCTVEDFELFPGTIENAIRDLGLSGSVHDQLANSPITFDAMMCPQPPPALNIFERFRGRKLCGGCWPYSGGGGGGCSDCENSNCDDDTRGDRHNRCRRRELLFDTISEDDRAKFLPVKIPVEQSLQSKLNTELEAAMQCLHGKELLVEVVFDFVPLGQLHRCNANKGKL